MRAAPSVAIFGAGSDPVVGALQRSLGARVASRWPMLLLPRPEVVFVRVQTGRLREAALAATLARARAVVCVPVAGPPPAAPWMRRYHRFLLESQEQAREWEAAGYALGRLVVIAPKDRSPGALAALAGEVSAMGGAPDRR